MAELHDLSNEELARLVEVLTIYADDKMVRLYWRGLPPSRGGHAPGGIEPGDLVQEALVDLLTGKRKRDSKKYPDLLQFLKSVIDSKVNHLAESLENKTTRRLEGGFSGSQTCQAQAYDPADCTPNPSEIVTDAESAQRFQAAVLAAIGDDPEAKTVLDLVEAGLEKPADIAEELGIPVLEINNIQKRLRRKLRHVLQRFRRGE